MNDSEFLLYPCCTLVTCRKSAPWRCCAACRLLSVCVSVCRVAPHWRLCSMFQGSVSLPGSPFAYRRSSRGSQFSWKKKPSGRATDRQPLVYQTLESLPLPFADDSAAVTPSSEDLCNFPFHKNAPNGRRYSFASQTRRHWPDARPPSRRSSFASNVSRNSRTSRYSVHSPLDPLKKESKMDTLFNFTRKGSQRVPDVVVDKPRLDRDNVSPKWKRMDLRPLSPFVLTSVSVSLLTPPFTQIYVVKGLHSVPIWSHSHKFVTTRHFP